MRAMLDSIPGLVWIAAAFMGVGVWTDDVRAIYVALFCLLLAGAQVVRRLIR